MIFRGSYSRYRATTNTDSADASRDVLQISEIPMPIGASTQGTSRRLPLRSQPFGSRATPTVSVRTNPHTMMPSDQQAGRFRPSIRHCTSQSSQTQHQDRRHSGFRHPQTTHFVSQSSHDGDRPVPRILPIRIHATALLSTPATTSTSPTAPD